MSKNCSNSQDIIYPSNEQQKNSLIGNLENYKQLYNESISQPDRFWSKISDDFHWNKKPSAENFLNYNFDVRKGPVHTSYMKDGETNICYNAVDRWIAKGFGDRIAYYWVGNDCIEKQKITYNELKKMVCKFSNVLKQLGIKKGDRVGIYMPVTIEMVVTMLACARIGAVHVVVFAGFGETALAERLCDAKCSLIVTANGTHRASKLINLQSIVQEAIKLSESRGHKIKYCISYKFVQEISSIHLLNMNHNLDWNELMESASSECEVVWLKGDEPLFILHTSGSTGKPKGILHEIAGYMLYSATVFKYVFNYTETDVFFCTADLGWITGHSNNVYGALLNCATTVLYNGTPVYPTAESFWKIIDEYRVTIFYTAPTAIRYLMKFGDELVLKNDRSSLKVLGLVGEPTDPESWRWFYSIVGNSRCPIVDTFFQTETTSPMITPLPGCTPLKPGSASLPFFGVQPALVDHEGKIIEGPGKGSLVFTAPWPGIAKEIIGEGSRFENLYFKRFPGYYFTGDGCRRDEDGYYWITGRVDDTFNVSGHLLSSVEVETIMLANEEIAEAAVVGAPHKIKGQCIYCYVVLKHGKVFNSELKSKLHNLIRLKIGPLADPEAIIEVESLPKTRSGKIMRRVLQKIAVNDEDFGDVSTMSDESSIGDLMKNEQTRTI